MDQEEINEKIDELRERFGKLAQQSWPCRVSQETKQSYMREINQLKALKAQVA